MEFLTTHWDDILLALTATVTAASAIAALTPTKSDDAVVDAVIRFIDKLGLNIGSRNPRQ